MKDKQLKRAKVYEIFALYENFGDRDYVGEAINQLEHASQAAELAMKAQQDDEVILAAFFHDLGHLLPFLPGFSAENMDGYGIANHERLAADYLKDIGFSDKVTALVSHHVAAKRYLTFTNSAYYEKLSMASKATLFHQGGVMKEEEARALEAHPHFDLILKMRYWDELAKKENHPILSLQDLKQLAIHHLQL